MPILNLLGIAMLGYLVYLAGWHVPDVGAGIVFSFRLKVVFVRSCASYDLLRLFVQIKARSLES
jgi:hypothetical protein